MKSIHLDSLKELSLSSEQLSFVINRIILVENEEVEAFGIPTGMTPVAHVVTPRANPDTLIRNSETNKISFFLINFSNFFSK